MQLNLSYPWKSFNIPTIQEWLHRITEVCQMEETVAQSTNNTDHYHKTWSPWFTVREQDLKHCTNSEFIALTRICIYI